MASHKLRIGVDGSVLCMPPRGGITRTYAEILPRICAADPEMGIDLFVVGRPAWLPSPLPNLQVHSCLRFKEALRPRRVLGRFAPRATGLSYSLSWAAGHVDLWHSTYFEVPLRPRVPVIVSNYDLVYWVCRTIFARPADRAFRRQQRRVLKAADHVVTNSETTRRDTIDLMDVDPDDVTAIPLSASASFDRLPDADASAAELGLGTLAAEARPFVLYVGSRAMHKNFVQLAQGLARWERSEFLLVTVGAPLEKHESDFLDHLGLADRLVVLSDVSDAALCCLYNLAAVFVYPSLYEGFGIPLLEAMVCGCPVAASRIPSSLEVAGDAAVFFDPMDPAEIATALEVAVSAGRQSPQVSLGMERARAFSWDRCARETIDIYRRFAS